MAFDRGLVAVGLVEGSIEIREIISGGRVRGWKGHGDVVRALVFTSDGRLVSGSWDRFAKKWDVETGTEVWSRDSWIGQVFCVSELADGRLVVGGQDSSVRVLDGVTGDEDRVDPTGVSPESPKSGASVGGKDLSRKIIRPRGEEAAVGAPENSPHPIFMRLHRPHLVPVGKPIEFHRPISTPSSHKMATGGERK